MKPMRSEMLPVIAFDDSSLNEEGSQDLTGKKGRL
jgi:hypothetical protein